MDVPYLSCLGVWLEPTRLHDANIVKRRIIVDFFLSANLAWKSLFCNDDIKFKLLKQ